MKIAQASLGERFYAIHGRLGDEAYRWQGKESGAVFVRTPEFRQWDKNLKCYLASDEPNSAFFNELKRKITVVTINDLKGEELDEFRGLFPNHKVRDDMMGVLDKLICSQAIDFLGSSFSTFSVEIKIMRSNRKFVFPELWALRHNSTTTSTTETASSGADLPSGTLEQPETADEEGGDGSDDNDGESSTTSDDTIPKQDEGKKQPTSTQNDDTTDDP
jgi:hypothetical protein